NKIEASQDKILCEKMVEISNMKLWHALKYVVKLNHPVIILFTQLEENEVEILLI
ncbi:15764_t:CDS:1, partial [Funneliformis mosseae]